MDFIKKHLAIIGISAGILAMFLYGYAISRQQKYGSFYSNPSVARPFAVTNEDGVGAATSTEFIGDVLPNTTDLYNLGSPAKAWKNVYASGTLAVSGSATSTFVGPVSSTRMVVGFGSLGNPAIQFSGDEDTGIYRSAANTLAIASSGSIALRVSDVSITAAAPIVADVDNARDLGTVSTRWKDGFFSGTISSTHFTASGGVTSSVFIATSGGTTAVPSFSFVGDRDTGMYQDGAGNLGFATDGTLRLHLGAAGTLVTSAAQVYPSTDNFSSLGLPSLRWATLNSINGDFTGTVSTTNLLASGTVTTTNLSVATTSAATATYYLCANALGQVFKKTTACN